MVYEVSFVYTIQKKQGNCLVTKEADNSYEYMVCKIIVCSIPDFQCRYIKLTMVCSMLCLEVALQLSLSLSLFK
jgi:hypothetical protein